MSLLSFVISRYFHFCDRGKPKYAEISPALKVCRDIEYSPRALSNDRFTLMDLYIPSETEKLSESEKLFESEMPSEVEESSESEKSSEPEKLLPVIVNVHGGAYVYGDKKGQEPYCARLAEEGFAVVNLNYHLAPDYKYPTQLEEINAAVTWIYQYASKYNLDSERVFLMGESAGAQLVAHYAAIYSNPDFAAHFTFSPPPISIKALALNCGLFDVSLEAPRSFKPRIGRGAYRALLNDYIGKEKSHLCEELDIVSHVNKDFPPSYLMTAQYDFLHRETEKFRELLKTKGVQTRYAKYGKAGQRNMAHSFQVNVGLEESRHCLSDECAFFRQFV